MIGEKMATSLENYVWYKRGGKTDEHSFKIDGFSGSTGWELSGFDIEIVCVITVIRKKAKFKESEVLCQQ